MTEAKNITRSRELQKPYYEDERFIGFKGEGAGVPSYYISHKKTGVMLFFGRDSAKEAIHDLRYMRMNEMGMKNQRFGDMSDHYFEKRRKEERASDIKYNRQYKMYGSRSPRWRRSRHTKRILEVGANAWPDLSATHAIDIGKFSAQDIQEMGKIKFAKGYDLNRRKMPYSDNYFDVVISFASLFRNFGTKLTYKEVLRVLKHGGRLEVGMKGPIPQMVRKGTIDKVTKELHPIGFVNIHDEDWVGGEWVVIVAEKPKIL